MVSVLLMIVSVYLLCGLLFAIPFAIKGVEKIDENAHDAGIGFRIIILPGTIVFWPLLLRKWLSAGKNNY